jgi:nucleotide-binding universal stress UspA family protein
MKIEHILVTTDLSPAAERAFQPAAELARKHGARVTLFHVVSEVDVAPDGRTLGTASSSPKVAAKINEALAQVKKQLPHLGSGVTVTPEVVAAQDFAKAITSYAAKHAVDVIVLSTHGRTGVRRLVLGSVAEAVLRHSTVPVLCLPPPA